MSLDFGDPDELTEEIIENATNPQIIKLGKKFDIKNFKNLADLRQKLLLTIMKRNNNAINKSFYTSDFMEGKDSALKEDKLRKEILIKYVAEVYSVFQNIKDLGTIRVASGIDVSEKDDPLKSKIMNEFKEIDQQFQLKLLLLSKPANCSLLVCGDSGAGKSSFINLLTNQNVLPTSIRSNTSCQVKLTYGLYERSEIVDLQDNKVLLEKKNFQDNLPKYLENLEDRTTISCKSATIYLDCPILEGGLDIYDTVGLGESKIFNEEITKHLQDITGIIFLLKRNNPIGDDTIGGLSQIINQMITHGIPGCSMHFIINMCDLLTNSDEKSELKQDVIKQVQNKCFNLNPDITTFSTKKELFLQENGFISKDYQEIMHLIQTLHLNSINTNTVSVYEFLFLFVWKTIDYIVESETFAAADKVNKKEYIHKLRILESDRKLLNQSFKKYNEKFIKEQYKKIKKELVNYLGSDEAKLAVVNEVVNKKDQLFGKINKDEIDHEIAMDTYEAILKHCKQFVEDQKFLLTCCNEMLTTFLQQFAEHLKKKELINQNMNRHIDTVMSSINLKMMNLNDLIGMPHYQRKLLYICKPIINSKCDIENTDRIVSGNWFFSFISKLSSTNVFKFYEQTTDYVKIKSSNYYNSFTGKSRNIKTIMDRLFLAPNQVTEEFDEYLLDDMNYLAKNICLLEDDMRKKENVIETYKDIKTKLEEINIELCRFSMLHLKKEKSDVMKELLGIKLDNDPVLVTRNAQIYNGQFNNSELQDSSILIFQNKSGIDWRQQYEDLCLYKYTWKNHFENGKSIFSDCFMEIRLHILSSINDYVGTSPMYSVTRIDSSLRHHIEQYKRTIHDLQNYEDKLYEEIFRLLQQIVNGLKFLHDRDPPLVHYDLSVDSIGYNNSSSMIKLCNISKEILVDIQNPAQSKQDLINAIQYPLCILRKKCPELYSPRTDIYCLGTIIFYLWAGFNPFNELVESRVIEGLDQFIEILTTSKFYNHIDNSMFTHGFADMVYAWCTLCWENKFTANSFLANLSSKTFYGEIFD